VHLVYLHGFASSANSSKARWFADRLAGLGLTLWRPDFNEPAFETLTVTRMLDQVATLIAGLPPGPVALFGSSLGAFVAWHAAATQSTAARATHPIEKLVLLAPALDFGANRLRDLGDRGLAEWQATDRLEVYHYGDKEPRFVHYALYEDARRYQSDAAVVSVPGLVFQGASDESVDPEGVRRFVSTRPHMTLHMLDDDHQLLASLDTIWRETVVFLGLPSTAP